MNEPKTRHQRIEANGEYNTTAFHTFLKHKWSLLGKDSLRRLYALEEVYAPLPSGQQHNEQELTLRDALVGQLYRDEGGYSRDMRYLAFLLLKQGRGGVIVGNPQLREKDGRIQQLPYTGLEGYYAGLERTNERSGMTGEEILQEEADIGAQLVKTIKKHCVEHNTWDDFVRMKDALAWKVRDVADIQSIQAIWGVLVRRLHVRVYQNPEFQPTLTEHIEHLSQLANSSFGASQEEQRARACVQVEYHRLLIELEQMSESEREQERRERRAREQLRAQRLAAFQRFHDETYTLLLGTNEGQYSVKIQDLSQKQATIIETMLLPPVPAREKYPPTFVCFSPGQLEGYLFISRLGEIGGDPLVRSVLTNR